MPSTASPSSPSASFSAQERPPPSTFTGKVMLDSLGWTGVARMVLNKPSPQPRALLDQGMGEGRRQLSCRGASCPSGSSRTRGEGILIIHGTPGTGRTTASPSAAFSVGLGDPAGVAMRVRGLNRCYGAFARLLRQRQDCFAGQGAGRAEDRARVGATLCGSWTGSTRCLSRDATRSRGRPVSWRWAWVGHVRNSVCRTHDGRASAARPGA